MTERELTRTLGKTRSPNVSWAWQQNETLSKGNVMEQMEDMSISEYFASTTGYASVDYDGAFMSDNDMADMALLSFDVE